MGYIRPAQDLTLIQQKTYGKSARAQNPENQSKLWDNLEKE